MLEVATFYTMFNLSPVGRYHVQLCGTTPCMLRGAEDLKKVCHKMIGHETDVTADGMFSWIEVECLGACVNAPMVQINADYYEDLTPEIFTRILNDFSAGRTPKPGPQIDRQNSAPIGGPTTLTDPSIYARMENRRLGRRGFDRQRSQEAGRRRQYPRSADADPATADATDPGRK